MRLGWLWPLLVAGSALAAPPDKRAAREAQAEAAGGSRGSASRGAVGPLKDDKACARGDAAACVRLADFLSAAGGKRAARVPKLLARAETLLAAACKAGTAACLDLARLVDRHDGERATKLYDQACAEGTQPACLALGSRYETGFRVAEDHARAAAYYKQVCDQNVLEGCWRQGRVEADAELAHALESRACDGGYAAGCSALGTMVALGRGEKLDLVRGTVLMAKGCAGGDSDGCRELDHLFVDAIHPRKAPLERKTDASGRVVIVIPSAIEIWDIPPVCDPDEPAGCKAGVRVAEAACKAKVAAACVGLALMARDGLGMAKDPTRAAKLLADACSAGHPVGCELR
jgi:TPR repeat protein